MLELAKDIAKHGLNPLEHLGLIPEEEFRIVLKRFVEDVGAKELHTRHRKQDIERYAKKLTQTAALSGNRVNARAIQEAEDDKKSDSRPLRPPKKSRRIAVSEELQKALEETGNLKLQRIYYSLCKIPLVEHTPLLTVGMWVFLETLTALVGRDDNTDFHSFLSPQRLEQLGLPKSRETRGALRQAVKRVSENGNTTKHNQTSAAFNSEMLANDADTMEAMLVALANETAKCT